MSLDELLAQKHPTTWVEFELGDIDEATAMRRFFADERPFDVEGLKACVQRSYRWLEGVEPLLQQLREQGAELHVLSNYAPWYRLIETQLGLSRYLPWSFVSCELGSRKPDAATYRRVIERLGVAPGDALLVDDSQANVEGARAAGLQALQFRDAASLAEALRASGHLE
jgi:HAD superfamily hydrolase (TIGR01509 family)